MAVYVDIAIWERHDRRWCHLLADDEAELHAFAAGLGIERRRFQTRPERPWIDHYDIDEPRRSAAIERGAIELGRREVVRLIARKRAATLARRSPAAHRTSTARSALE
jgi:hypothetical protein